MKLSPTVAKSIGRHIRRARNAMDVPLSYFNLWQAGVFPSSRTSWMDRRFIREILPALQDGAVTIYDIGAHNGSYTRAMLCVPNVRTVVAFEPNPESYRRAMALVGTSSRVRIVNCALSDEDGIAELNVSHSPASSSLLRMRDEHISLFPGTNTKQNIDVPVRKLDDIVREENLPLPNVVKIDVQGLEERVIRGGLATLSGAQFLLVEVSFVPLYDDMLLASDLIGFVERLGWRLVALSEPILSGDDLWISANALFSNTQSHGSETA